jgi:hypothetical protein
VRDEKKFFDFFLIRESEEQKIYAFTKGHKKTLQEPEEFAIF